MEEVFIVNLLDVAKNPKVVMTTFVESFASAIEYVAEVAPAPKLNESSYCKFCVLKSVPKIFVPFCEKTSIP